MATDSRIQQWLEQEYRPEMGTGVATDERTAKAAEYSAYHIRQISRKLDKLIEGIDSLEAMMVMKSD